MDTSEHLLRLDAEARRFATTLTDAAASGRLAERVPTCPEWSVRNLAEHVGGIYRWATRLVADGIVVETWRSEVAIAYPASDDDVAPWFDAGLDPLLDALGTAPPDRPVFVWGADPHARFWTRRLHHETLVHGVDLALAVGAPIVIDVDAAVDGIDEFLTNLPSTARWGAPLDRLRGEGETLTLRATDAPNAWRLRFEPTGCWWDRSGAASDATVRGTAADLDLFLQGRSRPAMAIDGDRAVVERFRSAVDF